MSVQHTSLCVCVCRLVCLNVQLRGLTNVPVYGHLESSVKPCVQYVHIGLGVSYWPGFEASRVKSIEK